MSIPIPLVKLLAFNAIDRAAGEARLRYISDLPGQAAVYLEKRAEAERYIAAHSANPGTAVPGPHIAAEAASRNLTPLALASEVATLANFWLVTVSPQVEALRVSGKQRARAATTEGDINAERDAVIEEFRTRFTGV